MMFSKPKTYRSKKYLLFIRTKPCLVCGYDKTVPHHEKLGMGGTSIKPPDANCVPLCVKCHDRHENENSLLWESENIDIQREIIKLLTEFLNERGI